METKALARKQKMEVVAQASPTPLTLLQQAIEQGLDLEKIEKLMELQERWEKKEAKKAFLDALSLFQSKVPELKKGKKADIVTKSGSRYSYKYTDLGSVTAQIKKPLQECGLSYRWEFQPEGSKLKATCFISHRDGHTETTTMESVIDTSGGKNDIQQIGSTQTYLQRYTLIGALGLSTADEDNDGRGAPNSQPEQPQPTEEEILMQWQQSVDATQSRVELTALYIKNKKTVDKNAKVQAIFKARQEQLPIFNGQKTDLP
jgi:aryl carrier-like protein